MRQGPFVNIERKRRGVGVSDLQRALGMSGARFGRWMRGEIDLPEEYEERAANAIGIDRRAVRDRRRP